MVGVGRDLCGSSSPTPCQSRVTYSRLHRTLSRRVLNISRDRDSTTSLGSLFQGSITLRGKKFFLMFRRDFLCFSSSRGLFFPDRRGLGLSCSRAQSSRPCSPEAKTPLCWCSPGCPTRHLGAAGKVSPGNTRLLVPLCHVPGQATLPEPTLQN